MFLTLLSLFPQGNSTVIPPRTRTPSIIPHMTSTPSITPQNWLAVWPTMAAWNLDWPGGSRAWSKTATSSRIQTMTGMAVRLLGLLSEILYAEIEACVKRLHQSSLIHISQTHGPLARYSKLQDVHAPGMGGTISPPPRVRDPDMHHGTCVTDVPGSLTSCFLWCRWRGKRSQHSRCMRNPQFCVSGKRSMHWIDMAI